MKRKLASLMLICIGIIILGYPKLSQIYYDAQQEKLIRQWQHSFQNIRSGEDSLLADAGNSSASYVSTAFVPAAGNEPAEEQTLARPENMEGMLVIDKIDLNLPILSGATEENLKTTAASIENTGEMGQVGNYAVAGHRNHAYGRNFNRLDELEEGDRIIVDNGEEQFEYTVFEKLYVLPEEVWVLESNGVDREITLVTCHPIDTGTHRLIIKGKMTD
ncbi:class D sortase [Paenibacillus senegalensis]|uniref:class D sortase n=1 Tax=Paenibacillus senegalensis TaxID=1465766 RepID=UPI000289BC7A|nr:class D sortase [Paenibacillus senegalensis]